MKPAGRQIAKPLLIGVRLLGGRVSFRAKPHAAGMSVALLLLVVALAFAGLASGRYAISAGEVAKTLFGMADDRVAMVVLEWRLPRVIAALLCGAALGSAGALFQSLTRNPLGSPDVLGFDAGAQTGMLLALAHAGGSFAMIATGAFSGAIVTAFAVGLLSHEGQNLPRLRAIVVGVGIAAMLNAFNTWLMLAADLHAAMRVAGWRAGSLVEIDFPVLCVTAPVILVLLSLAVGLAPGIRQLELGDDLAIGQGLRVGRTRLGIVLLGVGLTAVTTAIAGPVAFLALMAPQLARLAVGSSGFAPVSSALMGALVLLLADLVAARAFPDVQMPVGALTACLGGVYFVWLLLREARRRGF